VQSWRFKRILTLAHFPVSQMIDAMLQANASG
jgi:hypothetical protein